MPINIKGKQKESHLFQSYHSFEEFTDMFSHIFLHILLFIQLWEFSNV